jgi:hypothetical protein
MLTADAPAPAALPPSGEFAAASLGLDQVRARCQAFIKDIDALVAAKKARVLAARSAFHNRIAEDKGACPPFGRLRCLLRRLSFARPGSPHCPALPMETDTPPH